MINCTLTKLYAPFDSGDLFFKFGDTVIDDEHIQRPDNVTATLNMSVPFEWSGGHLFCNARNYTNSIGNLITLDHEVVTVYSKCEL